MSKDTTKRKRASKSQATTNKRAKQRVIDATAEILHNPQTPSDLFQAVAEYVCAAMNNKGDSDELVHSAPMLALILDSCPEDELMGAVIAARQEGL